MKTFLLCKNTIFYDKLILFVNQLWLNEHFVFDYIVINNIYRYEMYLL